MIKKYSIDKYKKKTLKLLTGVLIGATITSCSKNYSKEIASSLEEIAVYKLPLEEKLKTRGVLNIYFENNEYIEKTNKYVDAKVDSLVFYDDKENGYGVILSNNEPYQTTFLPGDYKFYSQYLDIEGEFTITTPGESLNLEIDYLNKTYNIYSTPPKK